MNTTIAIQVTIPWEMKCPWEKAHVEIEKRKTYGLENTGIPKILRPAARQDSGPTNDLAMIVRPIFLVVCNYFLIVHVYQPFYSCRP